MYTDKPTTEQSNRSHNNAFFKDIELPPLLSEQKKNGEAKVFLNCFMLECPRLFAA